MTVAALAISSLALIVSLFAYFERRANTKINMGRFEIEIRKTIEDSKNRISQYLLTMTPLLAKKDSQPPGLLPWENKAIELYQKGVGSLEQSLLNAYDSACAHYLDGKVDKLRFKKNFHKEIRNLMDSDGMKKYFDRTTSAYQPIIKVYDEWHNSENQKV